jgi:pyruvate-ferredoxin/flavodoxin oxidoreductase
MRPLHGSAYVAQIAMGANDVHALKTILEAEAFPGPSIIIAYSHCIAHGYDMCHGNEQQNLAVKTGYWPLFRYNPMKEKGQRLTLDCKPPSVALDEFLYHENRFATIKNNYPDKAAEFLNLANEGVKRRWETIEALKDVTSISDISGCLNNKGITAEVLCLSIQRFYSL